MSDTGQKHVGVASDVVDTTIFVRLFTVLRVFTGLVWLTNGLAKVINKSVYNLNFFSFNLVSRDTAKGILTDASTHTNLRPLGSFYQQVVLQHWGVWSVFLTLTELGVGIALILGVASRLAALGALLLIGPIWVMFWNHNLYLWQYPAEDLLPLVFLAIAPAGRYLGFDRLLSERLGARFGRRWPF